MTRKCHVRFGGGPGEKAAMTSLAVYPTSCVASASGSSSGPASDMTSEVKGGQQIFLSLHAVVVLGASAEPEPARCDG